MRHAGFTCAIVIALCAFPGCRSNTTYRFPTDENEFWARDADASDIKIFEESYKRFAYENAEILSKTHESFDFPVASSYQTGLALLNASEGETYAAAARFLRTTEPDEFSLNQGFGEFMKSYRDSVRSSLWMIWPIQPETPYVKEMAARFRIDTVKLGSVGLTAQKAVNKWMDRFPPELKHSEIRLSKSNQMMSLGGVEFIQDKSHPAKDIFKHSQQRFWIAGGVKAKYEIIFWEVLPNKFLPDFKLYGEKVEPIESPYSQSHFVVSSELDVSQLLAATESERLLGGKNDLRHLSHELVDEAAIPVMNQYTYVKVKLSSPLSLPTDKPIGYMIFKAGDLHQPLIIGKIAPSK